MQGCFKSLFLQGHVVLNLVRCILLFPCFRVSLLKVVINGHQLYTHHLGQHLARSHFAHQRFGQITPCFQWKLCSWLLFRTHMQKPIPIFRPPLLATHQASIKAQKPSTTNENDSRSIQLWHMVSFWINMSSTPSFFGSPSNTITMLRRWVFTASGFSP